MFSWKIDKERKRGIPKRYISRCYFLLNAMLISSEVSSFINSIKTTNHLILFYDSQESKENILFNYIVDGLKNNKGIVYVCSDEGPEQLRRGMETSGIDVSHHEKEGRLMIYYYDEWYIENGKAEPLRILNRWHEAHTRFKEKGLGMRITGETSCFFTKGMVRELLRYEYALHKVLYIPMDAICAYNVQTIVNTGYTDMIMPLVRAHGGAIFTSQRGTMILEPEKVEDTEMEKLLDLI